MTATLPVRRDADPATTWDVESVFPDRAAWEHAVAGVEAALPALAAFAGTLANGPAQLLSCLTAMEALAPPFERVWL